MSQGPVIISGPPGHMSDVDDQPDVYGLVEKWEVLRILSLGPTATRRECLCAENQPFHRYGCPDGDAFRPLFIPATRAMITKYNPLWQDFLNVLEKNPDAFITIR